MTGLPSGATRQASHASPPQRAPLHGALGHLTWPALRLLIGVSVYREPAGRSALLFQIGQADPGFQIGQADPSTAPEPPLHGPAPPWHAPANIAELVSECEDAGLLVVPRVPGGRVPGGQVPGGQVPGGQVPGGQVPGGQVPGGQVPGGQVPARGDGPPVFVDQRTAGALHRDLTAAGRGDEVTRAHRRAAEYWQWRAAAWPQDRHADLHDLLEGRHHLHEAGDDERAGAVTEVVCAQLHAWGELDHEAALMRETLGWLPPRSPLRAAWIREIGKIAQAHGNYAEAKRHYQQSLEIFTSIGDDAAAARSHHWLGILAQARGDYAEAERRYQESLYLTGQPAHTDEDDPGPQGETGPRSTKAHDVQPGDVQPGDVQPPRARYTGTTGGRHTRRGGRCRSRAGELLCRTGTALAAAVLLTALSAAGFTRFLSPGGRASAAVPAAVRSAGAAAVRRQAAAWMAGQLSRSTIISCDPAMCAALRAAGIRAGNLLVLKPSAQDPLGSDVVVATAAVRSQFGSRLADGYAPEVAAAFGAGNARIQVRIVAPDGAVAYRNALRADVAARKAAGSQLLRNEYIGVTAAARRQLAAGQVDSRLLIALAALASQHALRVVAFADSGPDASPGTPLRMAEISGPGTASGPAGAGPASASRGSSRFQHCALAFLRAQRPPYLATSVRTATIGDGQRVLQVEFASPSPLGLLNAVDASARTSP